MKKNNVQHISSVLVILCLLTTFFGIMTVALPQTDYATGNEGLYYTLLKMWRFFLFLPITIGSIVFGIIFKKRNYKTNINIVLGLIFSVPLLAFGSMGIIAVQMHAYSTDIQYLINIGSEVNFTFPNEASVLTIDWDSSKQGPSDDYYNETESVVRFKNQNEITEFKNRLSGSNIWTARLPYDVTDFIPALYVFDAKNYTFFMFYNIENNTYNTLSDEIDNSYIFIAFNSVTNVLLIDEFSK